MKCTRAAVAHGTNGVGAGTPISVHLIQSQWETLQHPSTCSGWGCQMAVQSFCGDEWCKENMVFWGIVNLYEANKYDPISTDCAPSELCTWMMSLGVWSWVPTAWNVPAHLRSNSSGSDLMKIVLLAQLPCFLVFHVSKSISKYWKKMQFTF